MTEPLQTNDFNIKPYRQNLFEAAAIPGPQCAFSGNWLCHVQAWGAYALLTTDPLDNIISGGRNGMASPVTDMGPGYQPPSVCECNGDFHQSAQYVVATPNTPKWVVTTIPNIGAFGQCSGGLIPAKVQIYKLNNTLGIRWHHQAFIDARGSSHRLDGDMAYIDLGNGWWTPVNMETMLLGTDTQNPPAFTPQPNIQGYSFTITKTSATNDYRLDRTGGPVALPCFYPEEPVKMERLAVFFVKLIDWMVDHPGQKLPVHLEQVFQDVAPGHQFYEWINKVGAAKIIAGKPCP